jgi:2-polyprenyl-6-methoxyphenol hydroxylase-like FAD-dependent oxidoreductase
MPDGRAKVVTVGAGFGGIEAAKSLRRAPVEVTVIERARREHRGGQSAVLGHSAACDVSAIATKTFKN